MSRPHSCRKKPPPPKIEPEPVIHISEEQVKPLLDWCDVYKAVEESLVAVTEGASSQPDKSFASTLNGTLMSMLGYLNHEKYGALTCKLVSIFKENVKKHLNPIHANILLFNEETGSLKAIIAGKEITAWRSAAASAVATKYLHKSSGSDYGVLAIIGVGKQGSTHAEAFHHFFKWTKIKLSDQNFQSATALAKELNEKFKVEHLFEAFKSIEDCIKDADVIISTSFGSSTVIKKKWLKSNVHINAIGTSVDKEIDLDVYNEAAVYVDCLRTATEELGKLGIKFKGDIGSLVREESSPSVGITLFQNLGVAVEDAAIARLIYDLYKSSKGKV